MQRRTKTGILGLGLAFLLTVPTRAASPRPGDDPLTPAERLAWLEDFLDGLDGSLEDLHGTVAALESRARAASSKEDQVLARVAAARLELALEGPVVAEDTLRSARVLEPDARGVAMAFLLATRFGLEASRGQVVESYDTLVRAVNVARDAGESAFLLRLELREFTSRYEIQEVERPAEEFAELRGRARALDARGLELWMDILAGLESPAQPLARTEAMVALAQRAVARGRPGTASRAFCFAANTLLEQGDPTGALEPGGRALGQALATGDRAKISTIQSLLARACAAAGNEAEALAHARAALAIVEGRGYDVREHAAIGSLLALTDRHGKSVLRDTWEERRAELCARLDCGETHELELLRASLERGEIERLRLGSQVARERAEGLGQWRRFLWLGLSAVAIALLHGRRRLARANAQLKREMSTARAAEEERLALQQQIHQVERLQGLGLIAGGIAHDFNNLLVGVLGNADLLRLSGRLAGQDREKVLEIRASAERASALCRQLLAYAGKAPMTRGRVDVAALVRRMQPVLRAAVSHGVVIRNDSSLEDVWVEADESQLEQILLNLVTNAKDAGARTVRLHVGATARRVGEDAEPRPCVTLEVSDDGEGMTAEVRRKVFDPFFTTRFPGRGLGLAAVFGIVGKHGGEIEVESEPGRGTRFELAFPRVEPPLDREVEVPRPPRTEVDPPRDRAGARVLVVDDEPSVRRLAARMLEALGLEAIGAADGTTALRELERAETPFTCVLLDVTMPGLDGPTVLARMRKMEPNLRIVLMSGHAERDVLGRCVEANPDALLPKPFGMDEFEAAVLPESACTPAAR